MKKWMQFITGCIILFCLFYIGLLLYAYFSPKLSISGANTFYLYDENNTLFSENNDDLTLNDISPDLIHATLSIEDKNFYQHTGFDIMRIIKALFINFTNGKTLQGASTITQQYAKNLFLDFDKKWARKMEEALLTLRLEAHYSKDEILSGYLNTINYGGVFGIENASTYYFGKHAKDLSLAEASILAGIPKSPSNYSPIANYEAAKKRQLLILNAMVENGYITEEEKQNAYQTELTFVGSNSEENISSLMYYEDAVLKELKTLKSIPNSFMETGGLRIYTNLNMDAQKLMDTTIKKYLSNSELQIASVLMDPSTGKIVAIAGGKDYSLSEFNRVTSSSRQVGSTIKPILYYAALENGFTASTAFTSEKTTFSFSNNKIYTPTNYGDNYANKPISMGAAIAYSDNIYAVKTHLFLGENNLVEMAKRLGIKSNLEENPSLALGTNEINILEMMKAYATFANEGYQIEPYFITKVEDIDGNVLYERKETKNLILNQSLVYILNNLLKNSYNKDFIDYAYPTCINIAAKLTKDYAIKTGTTNTDHLIFGYNKDAILGIWMGYDDNSDTLVKDGNVMKNIWADIIEEYLRDKENNWYEKPDNVVGVVVNPISGEIADDYEKSTTFYYIKGTQPLFDKNLEDILPKVKETST
ncbi:MAG: PBP1A family penicillin-binding protein [Tenericutes bacterium]|nr:PBP1A family penicillin-binding protein [Mycoplasmatota bacterium]